MNYAAYFLYYLIYSWQLYSNVQQAVQSDGYGGAIDMKSENLVQNTVFN